MCSMSVHVCKVTVMVAWTWPWRAMIVVDKSLMLVPEAGVWLNELSKA